MVPQEGKRGSMRYRYSAFRLLLAVTIILLAAIPPALATGEIPANIGTDAGPASAPTQEVNQADAAAAAGDVAPAPTGNIRWDTPRDLDHSLPEAGYGLSLARDNKTGLLHISYLEFSNKTDTPGMLGTRTGPAPPGTNRSLLMTPSASGIAMSRSPSAGPRLLWARMACRTSPT
jgi:hypothetical protein